MVLRDIEGKEGDCIGHIESVVIVVIGIKEVSVLYRFAKIFENSFIFIEVNKALEL